MGVVVLRRLAGTVALAGLSTVLGLAAIELVFRLLGLYAPVGFVLMPPSAELRDIQTDWDLTYRTNSRGLRDVERSARAEPGVFRVVAVGDSFTFGQGVPREVAFPARLQDELRRRGRKAEVINVSNIGVGSEAYLLMVRDVALDLHPDVVVLNVFGNDASEAARPGLFRRIVRALSHHLHLATLLRTANQRLAERRSARVGADPELLWSTLEGRCAAHHTPEECRRFVSGFRDRHGPNLNNLASVLLSDPEEVRRWVFPDPAGPGWASFESDLRRVDAVCRKAGVRLIVGIVPDGAQVDPAQLDLRRSLGLDLGEETLTEPGRFQSLVSDLARELGAGVYDPLPAFRSVRRGLYHDTDLHFTPEGHRLYAESLAAMLLSDGSPDRP